MRDSGTPNFRIPYVDESGQNTFRNVELKTLSSPFKMEGLAARVYYNPSTDGVHVIGSIAEPRLGKSGGLYRPLDPESGTVIATYAFYEKMYFYERKVLLPNDSRISWPRTVAVYSNVARLPPGDENNAMYVGSPADLTEIMPFSDEDHDALSFNYGVLGHEHFHAHFDRIVQSQLTSLKNVSIQDRLQAVACPMTSVPYELKLLRSWNEGLADFYGAITSEQPNFMMVSIKKDFARPVATRPEHMKTLANIKECRGLTKAQFMAKSDPDKRAILDAVDPYYNGVQLARAMFAVAERDEFPALGADAASLNKWQRSARYLIHRLKDFKTALDQKSNWEDVRPDFALCFFLKDLSLSVETKALVNQAFSADYPDGVAQCGGL